MMPATPHPNGFPSRIGNFRRIRRAHVEWVGERLSGRDWQIIEAVNRLRLMSGNQIERLCFLMQSGHARTVVRGRVLRRLVNWRVLEVLPRRIGGAPRGSAGAVYVLGNAGVRLLCERQQAQGDSLRVRHPGAPTDRTMRHVLAISELYACLMEQVRLQGAAVISFETEPAAWWPNGMGGYLKPDAYTLLALRGVREHWWIEVDLATESIPTVKRKLATYLNFVERGQLGPGGVVPRILISAITRERCTPLQSEVARLPAPAAELFVVCECREVPVCLLRSLRE